MNTLPAIVSVGLAGAVGYTLYRVILPKYDPKKPGDIGRKWVAYTSMIISFTKLPGFFRNFDLDPLIIWGFSLIFFGLLAYVSGYVYAKFINSKILLDPSVSVTKPD